MLPQIDVFVLQQLRDVMRRAEFTVASITALLGGGEITELKSRSPRLMHATRSGTPLDTLIRLFVGGFPVPGKQAKTALAPVKVDALARLGVVRIDEGKVVPLISILPHDDLAIASDQPARSGRAGDYVPGMLDSSVFLELFTIRRPVGTALDIGTGCGVQALRANLHSDHVIATDLSRRALAFARLNAALNGGSNIEFVRGSGFEPVAEQRFDLIVSNLPFVITPSKKFMYRDSGMKLDDFTHHILVDTPSHLTEGGYCQILCQWVELEGEDWRDRLQGWFDGSGCDVWVMKTDSRSPDSYAEKWIADTEPRAVEGGLPLFEEWMRFYATEGLAAIHSGAIAMRRREGANWIRMDEGPERARSPFGDAILRAFAAGDYLHTTPDEGILEARMGVSPHIYMVERLDLMNSVWVTQAHQLRFDRELEYMANVDRFVSQLVSRCNGERTIRELIQEVAAGSGIAEERLRNPMLQLIRGLVERGFMLFGGE